MLESYFKPDLVDKDLVVVAVKGNWYSVGNTWENSGW